MMADIGFPWLKIEKRLNSPPAISFLVPAGSLVLALVLGAFFLAVTGFNPWQVYSLMFSGTFGSAYGISETVVKAIPLMLAGLGISIAFRMQLWNIGAEGQIYMGVFAASWVALSFPEAPAWLLLPSMFLASLFFGGLWGLLPAIPRAYLGVNEIITSLMLNYVAILWVDYLIFGPWKDPKGFNFPMSAPFSKSATLPNFADTRIHAGLLFALVLAVIIYIVIKYSKWGYEIRVIGESESAARYAGIDIRKNIMLVMFISGAVCALAGMAEISGVTKRLQQGISPGYGYTAIIVAWLAKLNPFAIILASFLFGALQVGGYIVQTSDVPPAVTTMLQGLLLFFVLGGDILKDYRIVFAGGRKKEEVQRAGG